MSASLVQYRAREPVCRPVGETLPSGARWLTPYDEPRFIALLEAVYGSSYSYRELYHPGAYRGLLAARKLVSVGEFDAAGHLISHTGFLFKDPHHDFLESGMSFKHPVHRGVSP